MAGWRDLRQRARRTLHEVFKVPALYYSPAAVVPTGHFVRVHEKFDAVGDLAGTNMSYAEGVEPLPRIVFVDESFTPARGSVVIVSATEGYRLEYADPKDDISHTAPAVRLTTEELTEFETPDLYPELFE